MMMHIVRTSFVLFVAMLAPIGLCQSDTPEPPKPGAPATTSSASDTSAQAAVPDAPTPAPVAPVTTVDAPAATVPAVDAPSQAAKPARLTDFVRDIAPLLHDKCASCHQGEKAKNGFEIADRESVLGIIEPGDASASSLWTDYLTAPSKSVDKESLIMPPDAPLGTAQLALIKLWIEEGADWPEGATVGARGTSDPSNDAAANRPFATKLFRAFGYFHPAMVHFPIALFFLSGACAALSYFLGSRCQSLAYQCLVLATLTSIVTVVMGWAFADIKDYPTWENMLAKDATHDQMNFFFHRWLGTTTPVLGFLFMVAGLWARRNKSSKLHHLWRLGAVFMAGFVGLVGHQGGELIYGDIIEKAIEQLR